MNNVTTLFTQYSAAEVIILLILIGMVLKFVGELVDYFVSKIRKYFKKELQEEDQQAQLITKLDQINTKIDSLGTKIFNLETRVSSTEDSISSLKNEIRDLGEMVANLEEQSKKTDNSLELVQERLQNQSRDKLIELHHKYVYDYKMIDETGLQSMERTFLHYKAAGGNTFIDTLMDEVRGLPRLALENKNTTKVNQ